VHYEGTSSGPPPVRVALGEVDGLVVPFCPIGLLMFDFRRPGQPSVARQLALGDVAEREVLNSWFGRNKLDLGGR